MDISPLFAIDAQKMLGSGDSSGAVQLLEQGISVYPEYTTAYAVIARAYMQMRDAETAYEWVKRGLKRFPSHRALIILESDLKRQTFAGTTGAEEKKTTDLPRTAAVTSPPAVETPARASAPVSAPVVAPPVATVPIISEPVISEPVISEPVISEPVISEPVISEPVISDQVSSAPIETASAGQETEELSVPLPDVTTSVVAGSPTDVAPVDVIELRIDDDTDEDVRTPLTDTGMPMPSASESPGERSTGSGDEESENAHMVAEVPSRTSTVHEQVSVDVPHLPEADEEERLLDDALSNVDDDNDDWEHARDAVDDREVDVPLSDSSPVEPLSHEGLLDEALSNMDDDNDAWVEAKGLVDDVDGGMRRDEESEAGDIDGEKNDDTRQRSEPMRTDEVLQKINVVGGNVVMDRVFMRDVMERMELQGLRLVSTSTGSSRRTIRSSAMRLIPGLEFTPLRVQSSPKAYRSVSQLPEMPPFPVIRGSSMNVSPMLSPTASPKPSRKVSKPERVPRAADAPRTHLEELAQRLEKVRTPVTEEPDGITTRGAAEGVEPTMVTETMARIYEQQGFTEQAIKAYRQLARVKPEKRDEFERRIAALESSDSGE